MITIKPHHFVDIITSFGDGLTVPAPHPYGHAVHSVTEEILANRDVELRMEFGADDICLPCRHNIDGRCDDTIDTSYRPEAPESKQDWNLLIDQRWAKRLGIQEGDIFSARDLCRRIQKCSDNLRDIYREIPADRTEERQKKLKPLH